VAGSANTVTHHGTNRDRCSATSLIKTNALPLSAKPPGHFAVSCNSVLSPSFSHTTSVCMCVCLCALLDILQEPIERFESTRLILQVSSA